MSINATNKIEGRTHKGRHCYQSLVDWLKSFAKLYFFGWAFMAPYLPVAVNIMVLEQQKTLSTNLLSLYVASHGTWGIQTTLERLCTPVLTMYHCSERLKQENKL